MCLLYISQTQILTNENYCLHKEERIIKAYVFQLDVISQITGHELEDELKVEGNELIKYVKEMLIPEILRE